MSRYKIKANDFCFGFLKIKVNSRVNMFGGSLCLCKYMKMYWFSSFLIQQVMFNIFTL